MGRVPRVTSALAPGDRRGALAVRWRWRRDAYRVDPGLYALAEPGPDSPVLVTASYKLSFDTLRAAVPGTSAWILVLDTEGINVWCAAGKGTFGTGEIVARVQAARLGEVVAHRALILPQLGAPGVTARAVRAATGFAVRWGPVEARDLTAFLAAGEATPAMRFKGFPLRDRAALIPVELVGALRYALPALLVLLPGSLLLPAALAWRTLGLAAVLVAGIIGGTVLAPLALPWLPGRAFSVKGIGPGLLAAALPLALVQGAAGPAGLAGLALLTVALSSFLALNFTGCSTSTSLSGVQRELRFAVPTLVAAALLGLVGLGLG